MIWFALLLVGAVISGNKAEESELPPSALQHDVLAKGMLLQTSSLYLQRMYNKRINEKGEEIVESITKKEAQDDTEVISAIFERYVGLRLTINFMACVIFYNVGAAVSEAGEVEGCLEYARYVNWFNSQFTAQEYYDQLKTRGLPGAKYNLGQVVENMATLFEEQKVMFEVFEASGAQEKDPYVDVFERLRKPTKDAAPHPNLTEADAKPLVKEAVQRGEVEDKFRTDTLERLYKYHGKRLMEVENYWRLFFSQAAQRPLVTDPKQLVRKALVEEDAQRSHFKAMEESNLDATKHDFQDGHEFHYIGLLYHGLEMRVRNIAEVLPERNWKIVPADPGSQVDFMFKFDVPPPTVEAAGTSGGAEGSGGPSSSGGGDFGLQAAGAFAETSGPSEGTGSIMELS